MRFHFALLAWLLSASAFELFSPQRYSKGDEVELLLNKIESDHTQLPYPYHNLPFVCYDKNQRPKSLSLGEVLRGDRFWESLYKLKFGVDEPCARLCDMSATPQAINKADYLVRNGYVVHWSLDGLPGATTFTSSSHGAKYYAAGFPLGFVKDDISYYYNHVTLVIRYKNEKGGKSAIVGFEVYPKSHTGKTCPGNSRKYKNFPLTVPPSTPGKPDADRVIIPYSYSVYWREDSSIDYDNRWDLYYDNDNAATSSHIHWLSLINSLVLASLVSMVVAIVMFRVLKSDLRSEPTIPLAYNDVDSASTKPAGWKNMIDVAMGKPEQVAFLSILCASGVQCLVAVLGVVVVFVANSKLNFGTSSSSRTFFNDHQGAFFTCSVILLLGSGFVSAYLGIIIHKLLSNESPNTVYTGKQVRLLSCLYSGLLPFTILSSVVFLNFFVWAKESSNALPFGTIVLLLFLFGVIELPLGIWGGAMGNRFELPRNSFLVTSYHGTKGSEKPQSRKSLVMNPLISTIAFGIIPFGVAYVDILLIFNSVWLEKTTFYYMYGFLLCTTVLLLLVVAESSIVATYVSLTFYNNANWQWLSFRVGSSLGWYLMAYSIYYFAYNLHMNDFVSVLIYFAYMSLASAAVGVSCGAVAVISALLFIRIIYSSTKRD